MTPKRIMIFGRSGSGKSTFAAWLHKKTDLPLYHLDKYFFVENWVEREYGEFLKIQQELVDQEEWIIEGNSVRSLEMRYQKADLCLFFNYPKWLCLWRIIKRTFQRKRAIDDRAPNCPERFSWKLIKYSWTFEKRIQYTLSSLRELHPKTPVFEVRMDQDVQEICKRYFPGSL